MTHSTNVRTVLARIALTVFAVLAVSACEETVEITDVIYRERIVVYSVLHSNEPITVKFTRTLPINESYSEAAAALSDVVATITVIDPANGTAIDSYQLEHDGGGNYSAPSSAPVAQAGRQYRLNANWRGKTVSAETRVPELARIDSVGMVVYAPRSQWEDTLEHVRAFVRPRANETYLITSATLDPRTNELQMHDTYGGARLLRSRDTNANGLIELTDMFFGYRGSRPEAAVVVSYDEPYYEFQQTYYQYTDRGPFGSGADIVRWNVSGDGLGLFIGRTYTTRRL